MASSQITILPPSPHRQPLCLSVSQPLAPQPSECVCGWWDKTAAFRYWWGCLWIFEGPFNLAWEETRNQWPLWVAFILLQHNMLLFLKAHSNSCVNPLLCRNVSIAQRPVSHTHYDGVIHISPFLTFFFFFISLPSFFVTTQLLNMYDFPRNQTKTATMGGGIQNLCSSDSSYSRWPPLCDHAHAHLCA